MDMKMKISQFKKKIELRRKCTFSLYIFVLLLLVLKLINALHLSPYHHPTNRKS